MKPDTWVACAIKYAFEILFYFIFFSWTHNQAKSDGTIDKKARSKADCNLKNESKDEDFFLPKSKALQMHQKKDNKRIWMCVYDVHIVAGSDKLIYLLISSFIIINCKKRIVQCA